MVNDHEHKGTGSIAAMMAFLATLVSDDGACPLLADIVKSLSRRRSSSVKLVMKTLLLALYSAIFLVLPGPVQAADPLRAKDLKIEADIRWKPTLVNNQAVNELQIILTLQGPAATSASAYYSDPKIDSLLDDRGQPIPRQWFFQKFNHMLEIDRSSGFHPKGSLSVHISGFISPPIEKVSELRGSLALRTGGQFKTVVLSRALKRTDRPFDNESLEALGMVVQLRNAMPTNETVAPSKSASTPADSRLHKPFYGPFSDAPTELKERWLVTIEGKECVVVECTMVDSQGKPLSWQMSRRDRIDKTLHIELGYTEKLPDDAQLKLTMHVDPQILHVPFALKDIAVPPRKGTIGSTPISMPPAAPSDHEVPDTLNPLSLAKKTTLVSAMRNALAASLGLINAPGSSSEARVPVPAYETSNRSCVPLTPIPVEPAKPARNAKEPHVDR